jgi:diguanylate cyclase
VAGNVSDTGHNIKQIRGLSGGKWRGVAPCVALHAVVGDRVLRFVASTLKDTITGKDIAARYGGEEFAVIMPRTPLRAAVDVAEQLRLAVKKAELVRRSTGEKQSCLTISIGVAALQARTSPQALIEAADVCLHAAKRSGRNCVIGERDERLLIAVAG